jgi:cellulose synthase/poly-beta-1,6-N-acetylglucosamine synthase-like glycosyltransferase
MSSSPTKVPSIPITTYNTLPQHATAQVTFTHTQKIIIAIMLLVLLVLLVVNWQATLFSIIVMLSFFYLADMLFYFFLSFKSIRDLPEIHITPTQLQSLDRVQLPTYTIFCPLYKEHAVLSQFTEAMQNLDYPKDRLQVMLIFEEDDAQTIEIARQMPLPDYFEIHVVPHGKPKTKPKACNYALKQARGKYCVIYDAEDVPESDQLKKAILAFLSLPESVICVQAKLNFYNARQNILTRLFTAEYSLWFDLILSGLHAIQAPIPLGGTSNHFKTSFLAEVDGWDAFNVTEDCDLGMRLVKKRYRTAVIESVTYEEANSNFQNWFKQRSRWIKGYMQTILVHLRDYHRFQGTHKFSFILVVAGKIFSFFINPLMWFLTFLYFALHQTFGPIIESFYPSQIYYIAIISAVFGNFLYTYYYVLGLAKRQLWHIIPFAIFVPLYWLAMSAAAYYALYKLLTAPHHWYKTQHGLHLNTKFKPAVIPSGGQK